MLLVIIAVSIFIAVITKSSRIAVGGSFAVILVQYSLFMAGHIVDSLEPVLPFTICHYWDYNSILLDGVLYPWHLILLSVVAVLLVAASCKIFGDTDIPA